MSRAIRAIVWEILWKNRWVFPVLSALWVYGALMAYVHKAPPDAWWAEHPFGNALMAFLASLPLLYSPFTLMEGHGSWRMNSMTTRWSLRPIPAWVLAAVPLLLGGALLVAFMSAWRPIFREIAPRFDQLYVLAVMLASLAAMQAWAWTTARRPGQFWLGAALLFPAAFALQLVRRMPETTWSDLRPQMFLGLGLVGASLSALTFCLARASRYGAWPGQLLWPWQSYSTAPSGVRVPSVSSPLGALVWSDILPGLRVAALGWLLLACVVTAVNLLLLCLDPRSGGLTPGLALFAAVDVLPRWGMIYLGGYGMFLACQFGTGFHTRLDPFKATRPLTSQTLASCRLVGLALAWAIVWVPLLLVWWRYDTGLPAYTPRFTAMLAYVIAVSTSVAVGALPIHLLGRVEGLTLLLLTSFPCWGAVWLVPRRSARGQVHLRRRLPGVWPALGSDQLEIRHPASGRLGGAGELPDLAHAHLANGWLLGSLGDRAAGAIGSAVGLPAGHSVEQKPLRLSHGTMV
jgi:hypothetical protein